LDTRQFDKYVIRKTNQSSKTLFPVILDVDNPKFFELLELCSEANQNLIDIEKGNGNFIQKLPHYLSMGLNLAKLYFLPAIETNYIWTV
jgi:magnesium-protoporphyrin IX monomethyl ester (oxidative) cyclase